MSNLIGEIAFLFQRLDWLSLVDLALVSAIFFFVLSLVRGTQAAALLRGMILLVIVIALLTSLLPLPAFSWLLRNTLTPLLVAIPVIFAPEIRRGLERLGRAGSTIISAQGPSPIERTIAAISTAAQRLADQRCGALIVLEREDQLDEYVETGVRLDAALSPELLLQIFYVNTPLHDGAVIVRGERVAAAACVLPLSTGGTLSRGPDRQMGLRHRAGLGISEVSDAVAIVVSEESGTISVTHNGRMIRRLDINRLRNILSAFYHPPAPRWFPALVARVFSGLERLRRRAAGD
ncbi:MAG: TIGR00159 family protein [Chloroflexi bacterium RBG_13_68_17]|nr:MAG: TIGR00159 family protein [Chloroflexi bacterium RBG_13_68_17]